MIDITQQIANIEKIMSLMDKYQIDEVSVDYINIKKTRFVAEKKPITEEEEYIMKQHLSPSSSNPWDDIPQSNIDSFSVTGKI